MASTSLHLHDMQELALETTCAIFWYSTSRSHCTAHPQRPSHDTMHDGQYSRYCCTCLCIYSNRTSTSTLKRTHHPPSCQVLAQVLDQCLPSHRSIQNYKPRLTHNVVGGQDAFLFLMPPGRVGKDTVQAMYAVVLAGQVVEGLRSLRGRLL